jgi:ribosome-binding factor A
LAQLTDSRINNLTITDVDCKNGKYDAKVYFDGDDLTNEEIKIVKQLLKKANSRIKSYCLNATSWYKCPNFVFLKDEVVEKNKRLDELFAQIKKD